MILIEDTRNKIEKHASKRQYWANEGIEVIRSKLLVGDYSLANNQKICIDTKQDWVELANNLCGKQHERFRNECIRALNCEIRLVILVEDKTPVAEWKSPTKRNGKPVTTVKGEVLSKIMATMHEKYKVEFVNCSRADSPDMIVKILNGEQTK